MRWCPSTFFMPCCCTLSQLVQTSLLTYADADVQSTQFKLPQTCLRHLLSLVNFRAWIEKGDARLLIVIPQHGVLCIMVCLCWLLGETTFKLMQKHTLRHNCTSWTEQSSGFPFVTCSRLYAAATRMFCLSSEYIPQLPFLGAKGGGDKIPSYLAVCPDQLHLIPASKCCEPASCFSSMCKLVPFVIFCPVAPWLFSYDGTIHDAL